MWFTRKAGESPFSWLMEVVRVPRSSRASPPLAPSSFGRDPISMNRAKAASEEEIQEVIRAFVQAARRAMEAGADGLQLHCAHGYLLSEFLSPFFQPSSRPVGRNARKHVPNP